MARTDKGYIPRPHNPRRENLTQQQEVVETIPQGEAHDPFNVHIPTEEEAVAKAKNFWDHYGKKLSIALGILILGVLGWVAYNKFMKEPKEVTANEAIFPAESLFDKMSSTGLRKDSVNILLNGGEYDGKNITGLLKFMNNNGGTLAANRATYMTGAAYLHIGEFDKAIKYLKEFDGHGAYQVQSKAYVMLGHAYAEKKDAANALSYYKKAAEVNTKDPAITSDALMLAADYAQATGKNQDAISLYKKIKEEYPTSTYVTGGQVEKNLAKLGVLN